jgi:hypothetical protein
MPSRAHPGKDTPARVTVRDTRTNLHRLPQIVIRRTVDRQTVGGTSTVPALHDRMLLHKQTRSRTWTGCFDDSKALRSPYRQQFTANRPWGGREEVNEICGFERPHAEISRWRCSG